LKEGAAVVASFRDCVEQIAPGENLMRLKYREISFRVVNARQAVSRNRGATELKVDYMWQ
jgi:hypothetical protein